MWGLENGGMEQKRKRTHRLGPQHGEGGSWRMEGLSSKEKGLIDMDNRVEIAGGGVGWRWRRVNKGGKW